MHDIKIKTTTTTTTTFEVIEVQIPRIHRLCKLNHKSNWDPNKVRLSPIPQLNNLNKTKNIIWWGKGNKKHIERT